MDVTAQGEPVKAPKRSSGPKWVISLGGISAVFAFCLLWTPVFVNYRMGTLADEHSLCNSGMGVLARNYSDTANATCTQASDLYTLGIVLLAAGLAAVAGGVIWLFARRS
jgi:hypothetical protein